MLFNSIIKWNQDIPNPKLTANCPADNLHPALLLRSICSLSWGHLHTGPDDSADVQVPRKLCRLNADWWNKQGGATNNQLHIKKAKVRLDDVGKLLVKNQCVSVYWSTSLAKLLCIYTTHYFVGTPNSVYRLQLTPFLFLLLMNSCPHIWGIPATGLR